jgi:citrate lyase subunit beta/citryl-CoA lyase
LNIPNLHFVYPIQRPLEDEIRGEAHYARRLGYRSKALVRPEHADPINEVFTPSSEHIRQATAIVNGFEAARARGEDRALVDSLWVEVPTYRNAQRLIERARRMKTQE